MRPRWPNGGGSAGSLRRRNVGILFSREYYLKYVLMKYEISILSCLKTTHPKNVSEIFYGADCWNPSQRTMICRANRLKTLVSRTAT